MTTGQPQLPGFEDSRFTVYDPFAEALYCRATFDAACAVADHLGCSLILEVEAANLLRLEGLRRRFRKEGGEWRVETLPASHRGPQRSPS